MNVFLNLTTIIIHKISGKITDFFQAYKYDKLQKYYGDTCLDVGSGTARFSKFITEKGHKTQPIDIVNQCEYPELNPVQFEGKRMAFENDAFLYVHSDVRTSSHRFSRCSHRRVHSSD